MDELGILIQSRIDIKKSVENINRDLDTIAKSIKSLNLNIDTSGMINDINKQIESTNKKSKGIKIDTDFSDLTDDFDDANKAVQNLKEKFGATTASIKKEIDIANNKTKSWLVTLKKAGEESRQVRLTPQDNGQGFHARDLTINDDREIQNLKMREQILNKISQTIENRNREERQLAENQHKAAQENIDLDRKNLELEKKKTDELEHQLGLARRQAQIDAQGLRARYGSILSPSDNKELDDYVESMKNLSTTDSEVHRKMQNLHKDFKQISANAAEAKGQIGGFGYELKTALQRIPIWMIGLSAFYAPLRGNTLYAS